MKIKDLRDKTEKELHKVLAETRNDIRELKFKVASKQLKNFKEIGQKKIDISRILTVLNEKRLAEEIGSIEDSKADSKEAK